MAGAAEIIRDALRLAAERERRACQLTVCQWCRVGASYGGLRHRYAGRTF